MLWQALITVRRLPVSRCIPVHGDFLTVGNYQHDSRRQNCRGGDDTLRAIAPYFLKPPHYARRNNKRVGEEAPEKQVYRRSSRLAVCHYRESHRTFINSMRRKRQPDITRISRNITIQRIGVYMHPHCGNPKNNSYHDGNPETPMANPEHEERKRTEAEATHFGSHHASHQRQKPHKAEERHLSDHQRRHDPHQRPDHSPCLFVHFTDPSFAPTKIYQLAFYHILTCRSSAHCRGGRASGSSRQLFSRPSTKA